MAKQTNVSCVVMDYTKQRSTMAFDVTQSFLEKLFGDNESTELKTLIETYSYGKVIKASQTHTTSFALPDKAWYQAIADLVNSKIGLNCVDQKAVLIFRFTASGKPMRLALPAPKQDLFYYVEEQGLRVVQEKGEAIATKLSQILGFTVEFVRGYHTGKK